MLRFIVFAVVFYILYRMFQNERAKKSSAAQKQKEKRIIDGEMVKDPECGVYVDVKSSITVSNGKTVYHFCSYDCREKFLKRLAASAQTKE